MPRVLLLLARVNDAQDLVWGAGVVMMKIHQVGAERGYRGAHDRVEPAVEPGGLFGIPILHTAKDNRELAVLQL